MITFSELNATSPVRFPEELLICNTKDQERQVVYRNGQKREEVVADI